MTKVYYYDLNRDGFRALKKDLKSISRSIRTKKFRKFLADKLMEELIQIQRQSLTTVNTELDVLLSNYISSNHVLIGNGEDETILIYNDAEIDVSQKPMSEETKANYPGMTLSLAKLVEYGMGYTGLTSTPNQEEVEDWEYDVNNHGYTGWYYYDNDGERYWTNGFAGRMVFYQLKQHTEQKIFDWIAEYWVQESIKSL